jgi:hypothetical protein
MTNNYNMSDMETETVLLVIVNIKKHSFCELQP